MTPFDEEFTFTTFFTKTFLALQVQIRLAGWIRSIIKNSNNFQQKYLLTYMSYNTGWRERDQLLTLR